MKVAEDFKLCAVFVEWQRGLNKVAGDLVI